MDLSELEEFGKLLETVANEEFELTRSLLGVTRNCYSYGRDNVDKYVSCMEKKTEIIDEGKQKFEFRKAFLNRKFKVCLKAAEGNPEAVEKCKNDTIYQVRKCYLDFIDFVKKS